MIDPSKNQDTSLIHRKTETKPSRNISQFLIGRPLQTADAAHETIGKTVGLAVFASDALSSTAYATQEMLVILAAAGTLAFGYVFRISIVIVGLLFIVVVSYQQIIHAYPGGGGAYIVAYDNLGYIAEILASRQANETITIVVPHFVPENRLHNMLHMQTAEMLRRELLSTPGVVITEVPYQVP